MSLVRTARSCLALALLGGSALVAVAALPASAAIVGTCTYGTGPTPLWASQTCYDDNSSYWYLRADCERFNGVMIHANGTAAYGPGVGTSRVKCPDNTELMNTHIVLVNY